jgi:hypothetical protein
VRVRSNAAQPEEKDRTMRNARVAASLLWIMLALPITCAQQASDGLYTGGVTPSTPGGRINPAEPGFVNGGGSGGGGP